jgi:peptidyl-prolyl cis-trans isomerase C
MTSARPLAVAALALALASCARMGCSNRNDASNPVVATVNSDSINLSTYKIAFNRAKEGLDQLSQTDPKTMSRLKTTTLNRLIFAKLIEQEAAARQIVVTEEELDRSIKAIQKDIPAEQFQKSLTEEMLTFEEWKEMHRHKLLTEKVARVSLNVNSAVAEDEMARFFESHKEDFASEPKVRARQIYVTDESLADDLMKRLKNGASFEELAKKYSQSPDAQQGGDLGFFSKDEKIPEFNVAFENPKNTVYPKIIKSQYGFHLLKTRNKQQPTTLYTAIH